MTNPIRQEAREEFDKMFPCLDIQCDNNGTTMDSEGEPEPCEYCYRERLQYKSLIDSLITRTRLATLEEVKGMAKEVMWSQKCSNPACGHENHPCDNTIANIRLNALHTLSERQQEAMKIDTRGSEEQVEAAHCGLYHWNDTLSALREKWKAWTGNK